MSVAPMRREVMFWRHSSTRISSQKAVHEAMSATTADSVISPV